MWKKCDTVQHLVCGCEKLAQREYKRRHDNVAKRVHWDFCKKNGLEHTEKWYEHVPEGVVQNEEVKFLWDICVQCDNVIEARRPDITVIDKKERKGIINNNNKIIILMMSLIFTVHIFIKIELCYYCN